MLKFRNDRPPLKRRSERTMSRIKRGLMAALATIVGIGTLGLTAVAGSTAAVAAEHPAYPYNVTFVWKLADGSTKDDLFGGGEQTLVAWEVAPADNPDYHFAYPQNDCGGKYQIDHYRITSEADQAVIDRLVAAGKLGEDAEENNLGWAWSNTYPALGHPIFWSYEEAPAEACKIAPVEPTVQQAVCTAPGGPVTAPSVTLPADSDRVKYSQTGTVAAGSTVTVTATPQKPYSFSSPLPDGWKLEADGSATFAVVLKEVPCDAVEVAPVTPTVKQAECLVPGDPTKPTLTLAETEGIVYTVKGTVAAGETVTVTASPDKGYKLGAADGWVVNPDGTATASVKFDNIDCEPVTPPTKVSPVAPTLKQAECLVPGDPTTPTLTLAKSDGITYTTKGNVAEGQTVIVTATPAKGRTLAASDGWTMNADGTATYKASFADIDCAKKQLARTGANTSPLLVTSAVMVLLGGSLLMIRRRVINL